MSRRFCVTIDLVGALQMSDRELSGVLIDDTGRHLTPAEVRALCVEKLRAGYDVLPVCDRADEKGYCQGHEVDDA